MNFLLFVVLPALVIGAMTHYSAGVEAFLILFDARQPAASRAQAAG